ncbi:methyltransferase domain-containing protein [Paraburkholderia lycopersici]|uniref:methyltransferase domain-containing protein n=1 Tax=Paraburkholderia lycopersici TaxID=416944 RepID=UPI001C40A542|nr:methyltransferase domain-containing protein [Paraburkholderia lycopersici]
MTGNASWSFGGDTSRHFEAHVSKSVPRYADGHRIVLGLSDFFVKRDSVCYEIGCSTGTLTRQLAQCHAGTVRWVGIDIEANMIDQAKRYLTQVSPQPDNVQYLVGDALSFEYEPSDLIVAYYTVQFIAPRVRQQLLDRIYQSLNWGGAFLLFERVRTTLRALTSRGPRWPKVSTRCWRWRARPRRNRSRSWSGAPARCVRRSAGAARRRRSGVAQSVRARAVRAPATHH